MRESERFRNVIIGLILLVAVAGLVLVWQQEPRLRPEASVAAEPAPEGELADPVEEIVQDLQKVREDFQAVGDSVGALREERDELKWRINDLLDDRDELTRRVAELEAEHPVILGRQQAGTEPTAVPSAKVANFENGTVFFAPSCGQGTNGSVLRSISPGECRIGWNRSCVSLDRTFTNTAAPSDMDGTIDISPPVRKPIPFAIAPYRPRQDLLDARDSR